MEKNVGQEGIVDFDKLEREVKQLQSMGEEDVCEIIHGYHRMLLERISVFMKDVQKIANLSPATIGHTKTALIVAESDFLDDKDGGDLKQMCVLGSTDRVVELYVKMFRKLPDEVFDSIAKEMGYAKA